ncbi:MAG: cobalt-precorrin 5A hydrolase [Clostridia bacterium]|nr:cobalt-precorrin 5A hydrolase [Clostridia bacterium]
MKLALFTLNDQSLKIAEKIARDQKYKTRIFQGKEEYSSFSQLVASVYKDYEGLVFIMATGIVVRTIAPLLQNKAEDPAVLVIDPQGEFVISLLSGHLGGANKLAKEISHILKAQPVITTATDVLGKKSVEEWAQHFNLKIVNLEGLVKVNGALVRGEKINVFTEIDPEYFREYPLTDSDKIQFYPLGFLNREVVPGGVCLSISKDNQRSFLKKVDLQLVVGNLVVGIGCRQGVSREKIKAFLKDVFSEAGLNLANLRKLVSIDIKREEKGLIALAKELGVSLEFFTAEELKECLKENKHLGFSYSKFVEKTVGVGAVCEPAALKGSRQGRLLIGKRSREGMTLAVVEEKLPWWV